MTNVLSGRVLPDAFASSALGAPLYLSPNDLAFTQEESCALVRLYGNSPESQGALWHHQTSGWPLALDVLARHARGSALTASERDSQKLLDDAIDALFASFAPDLLHLMRVTATPRRFNLELAAELLRVEQAQVQPLFSEILARNLFIETLEPPGWYRYHELIRARLQTPELSAVLDPNIVEWFAAQGDMEMAIEHALEAGLGPRAAQFLNELEPEFIWDRGRYLTWRRWVEALDPATRTANPDLLKRLGCELRLAKRARSPTTPGTDPLCSDCLNISRSITAGHSPAIKSSKNCGARQNHQPQRLPFARSFPGCEMPWNLISEPRRPRAIFRSRAMYISLTPSIVCRLTRQNLPRPFAACSMMPRTTMCRRCRRILSMP